MLNKTLYQFSSILLALFLLLGNVGFSIDFHYCNGNLKNFSFNKEAKSCHEIAVQTTCTHKQISCHKKEENNDCNKNCCSHETLMLNNSDNQTVQPQINSFQHSNCQFIIAFTNIFILYNYKGIEQVDFQIDKPPPLTQISKQVLFQTFLI